MSASLSPNDPLTKYGGVSKAKFFRDKQKRAFDEIEKNGDILPVACEHCFKHGIRCVVMSSSKSVKCASCASKGIKCVNVSWESLDRTRETTKTEIEEDMDELEKLMERQREVAARIARKRKVLKLAEARAKAKTICLLDELEDEEESQRIRNGGMTDGELEELSRDFVAYNNTTESAEVAVWSAWDESRQGSFPVGSPVLGGSPRLAPGEGP
jgi:hypothetical protein